MADPQSQVMLSQLSGSEWRSVLASPDFQNRDFMRWLVQDLKLGDELGGDPEAWFVKRDLVRLLRAFRREEIRQARATIDGQLREGFITPPGAIEEKRMAKAAIQHEYKALIKSVKDAPLSVFEMVMLTTCLPYALLEPLARCGGTKLAGVLSEVPGVYGPGEVLSNGTLSPPAEIDFPDPYILSAYLAGTVIVSLWVAGTRDTFKNSPFLMGALDLADGAEGVIGRIAGCIKAYVAGSRPDFAFPENATVERAWSHITRKYGYLFWHHGFVAVEQELLKDFNQISPRMQGVKARLSRSRLKFLRSLGNALPGDTGEIKTYLIDVFALNVPAVAMFSGLLVPLAEITRSSVTTPDEPLPFGPADVAAHVGAALVAGAVAWLLGCLGNLVITDYYQRSAPPQMASVKAANARQVYGLLPYLPIMAFLIPAYHWAWQQGLQFAAGTALLYGVTAYFGNKSRTDAKLSA